SEHPALPNQIGMFCGRNYAWLRADKLNRITHYPGPPMRTLIAMFIFAAATTGCAVYTPSGSVVVDPKGSHDSGKGKFCPPGQAKKGNC
ncbi:hypothetical protein, partial [Acidovorax sp. 28-64-14]|uniref:hypothetical protein n=1 Tax=Acidovorax sp. 28-64-14 TaxID=1970310 RepID=UPI0025B80EF0